MKGGKLKDGKLPELRKIKNNYGYKLSDPQSKEKKAIDKSIRAEARKQEEVYANLQCLKKEI